MSKRATVRVSPLVAERLRLALKLAKVAYELEVGWATQDHGESVARYGAAAEHIRQAANELVQVTGELIVLHDNGPQAT